MTLSETRDVEQPLAGEGLAGEPTRGPWLIAEAGVRRDAKGREVYTATIRRDEQDYRGEIAWLQDCAAIDGIGQAECNANARLIAAAPELLKACQLAHAILDVKARTCKHAAWKASDQDAYEALQIALAKARGSEAPR